jgi:DNA-binding IclR family transcriptional regulator
MELLHILAESDGPATIAEIQRRSEIPRATVTRSLATLADLGFVERDGGGDSWILGYELVRLARRADPYRRLVRTAEPVLERLRDRTGETPILGVSRPPRPAVEVVLQVDSRQLIGVTDWVGRTFDLYASAFGKLLLAELSDDQLERRIAAGPPVRLAPRTKTDPGLVLREIRRVRDTGYATSIDELEEGLSGIAAPVRDGAGGLRAMIGLSGPTFRLDAARLGECRDPLLDAVTAVERDLE